MGGMSKIRKTDRPVYFDIDGTLTDHFDQGGVPNEARIAYVKDLIAKGYQVVVWSGGGTKYAQEFAARHGVEGATCIGKPESCVDDNPDIRPRDRMRVWAPEDYFPEQAA